jgi:hypothetical protein
MKPFARCHLIFWMIAGLIFRGIGGIWSHNPSGHACLAGTLFGEPWPSAPIAEPKLLNAAKPAGIVESPIFQAGRCIRFLPWLSPTLLVARLALAVFTRLPAVKLKFSDEFPFSRPPPGTTLARR